MDVKDKNDDKRTDAEKKWDEEKRKDINSQIKTRSKVQGKESVRPTVITSYLISDYIREFNKENRIFDKDDMFLWELTHLSLPYHNIIDINNLKGMENLRKLQLDNNIIFKIQNIEHLINLEWLDLSFNQIEKIEGLDTLAKLTDLSLYSNQIEVVSGLDKLLELNILSLGKNRIKSYDQVVSYVRDIPNKLEVLTLDDNPCTQKDNKEEYTLYVIAYLSNLKYLDYHLIKQEQRDAAIDKHREDIDERNNLKEADKNVAETPMMAKEDKQLFWEAHVYVTVNIFQHILAEDENNEKLKVLPSYGDIMQRAEEDINEKAENFRNKMVELHKTKKYTIEFWSNIMKGAETESEKKSIEIIDKFKSDFSREVSSFNFENASDKELDDFQAAMFKKIDELEDKLMSAEMKLVEILALAMSDFNTKIEAINTEMNKLNTDFAKDMNDFDSKFRTELREHAYKLHDEFMKDMDSGHNDKWETEIELVGLLYEKDLMTQYFELAKDFQEQKITEKEMEIRIAIKNDWTNTKDTLENQQHDRNRNIILEIIRQSEEKKKEIKDLIKAERDRY